MISFIQPQAAPPDLGRGPRDQTWQKIFDGENLFLQLPLEAQRERDEGAEQKATSAKKRHEGAERYRRHRERHEGAEQKATSAEK